MSSTRTADQDARFVVPIVDDQLAPVTPTGGSWELFDARGVSIATGTVTPVSGTTHVEFVISANDMSIADGSTQEGREIVVTATTASGDVEVRDYFVLSARNPLALMVNSLVTYPEALALRQGFGPVLSGWDATPLPASRQAALAQAFNHLMRMSYRVKLVDPLSMVSSYAAFGTGTDEPFDTYRHVNLSTMTIEQFDLLPEDFRNAVKRAQLVEADVLLGGDVVGQRRQLGIISETIGESSTTFSSKPYLNLPISRQAFEQVRRYVTIRIGVTRA